jgi:hypothetical protein
MHQDIQNQPNNALFLAITTITYIISNITASTIAATLTGLLAVVGIINYLYSIKKTKLEIKKLKKEQIIRDIRDEWD